MLIASASIDEIISAKALSLHYLYTYSFSLIFSVLNIDFVHFLFRSDNVPKHGIEVSQMMKNAYYSLYSVLYPHSLYFFAYCILYYSYQLLWLLHEYLYGTIEKFELFKNNFLFSLQMILKCLAIFLSIYSWFRTFNMVDHRQGSILCSEFVLISSGFKFIYYTL